MKYVAVYSGSREKGEPLYFEKQVAIGPKFTADPKKAALFDSPESAERAAYHPMCFVKVEEVAS